MNNANHSTVPRLLAMAGTADVQPDNQSWFRISNLASDAPADAPLEIYIYGQIGFWGVTATDFIAALRSADDGARPVNVYISSIGGSLFDGLAIHNVLRRLGERVTGRIDAIAASIASVIAVGCHRLEMPANTLMMIHNPRVDFASGESDELRDVADVMDKARDSLIACYRAKATALPEDEIAAMMASTTWLTAAEAVAMGLADAVIDHVPIQASAELADALGRIKGAPATLLAALSPPREPEPSNVLPDAAPPAAPPAPAPLTATHAVAMSRLAVSLCARAGLSEHADAVMARSLLADEASVQAAVAYVGEIKSMCAIARRADLTARFVADGADLQVVRAALFDALVAADVPPVDNTLPQETTPPPAGSALNPRAIWAARSAATTTPNRRIAS